MIDHITALSIMYSNGKQNFDTIDSDTKIDMGAVSAYSLSF